MRNLIIKAKPQVILFLLLISACQNNRERGDKNVYTSADIVATAAADTNYVRTGFYFLGDTLSGVKMSMKSSGQFFYLEKSSFASVDDVAKQYLEKHDIDQKIYKDLCLKFNAKGTKDLAEGTGNPFHTRLAVVIANRLLYVVDNSACITTGVMCVSVTDYSDQEIQAMEEAVKGKR